MHTLTQVLADTNGWGHMAGWGGGWMWLWGTFMMVAVVAGFVWLFTQGRGQASGGGGTRARDILEERYARGELTTEEYRERLDQLR